MIGIVELRTWVVRIVVFPGAKLPGRWRGNYHTIFSERSLPCSGWRVGSLRPLGCGNLGAYCRPVAPHYPLTAQRGHSVLRLPYSPVRLASDDQRVMLPGIDDRPLVYDQNSVGPQDCCWPVRNHH